MNFLGKLASSLGKKRKPSTPSANPNKDIADFQKEIGYRFKNPSLLIQALTHPSFHEHKKDKPNNQRLEFLGDSILGAILAEELFHLFPEGDEGFLSRNRAVLVRGSSLAKLAKTINLGSYLLMSPSEKKNFGNQRESTLEDGIEALIGAIFLDGGLTTAKERVLEWLGSLKPLLDETQVKFNPKGRLQEFVQATRPQDKIRYKLERESGPPHKRKFEIKATIGSENFGRGEGKSKKEAEEAAALVTLRLLGEKVEKKLFTDCKTG